MGETRDNDADEEEEEKASDFVTTNVDGKAAKKRLCLWEDYSSSQDEPSG
ncbi:DEAD-box ATP-dependent RNA helicase 56-like protein [Corchorus olitorius]|uniref:DEAD-box ATP-dependent RNA helicase 56-like protein n=1 Tax=Corchorus olitorius TaxID=93759 RepID=A0A1R3IQA2_9ROSI|nr:DEAD-box ATP-dependent RNA helicase 56-like protein [Corchorus olitorius]